MQYLVTGANGTLGSKIVDELLQQGDDVLALYHKNTDNQNSIAESVVGDVTDYASILRICKDNSIDGIFHYAAIMDVRKSEQSPVSTHNVNVSGTLNVLKAAQESNISRILYPSSASVYGNNKEYPVSERAKLCPISFYGLTKQISEQYVEYFSDHYDMSSLILRYFNVYGPDKYREGSFNTIISLFVRKTLFNETMQVYGDGTQTRDYIYDKDAITQSILAMKSGARGIYNIGSGTQTSINQIISILQNLSGNELKVKYLPQNPNELKHSCADISAAKKAFSFNPTTTIDDGIKQVYSDYLSRMHK